MRLAIILLMCGAAWGQANITVDPTSHEPMVSCNGGDPVPAKYAPDCTPAERFYAGTPFGKIVPDKPLACPKYQHLDPPIGIVDCGIDPSRNCTPHCVDDIHTVTEREWAELMARLKALEHPIMVDGTSASDCRTPPDDPTKPCDKNQPSRKGKK